jgi:hypothetical protein
VFAGSLRQDRGVDGPAVVVIYDPGWPGLFRELRDRVAGSRPHRDHVDLRDFLRANPGRAARYGELKRRLAGLLATDRLAYSDGKAEMIAEFLRQARCRTVLGEYARNTPTWQFSVRPAVPEYCRCTPADRVPFFRNLAEVARAATEGRRTAVGSAGLRR